MPVISAPLPVDLVDMNPAGISVYNSVPVSVFHFSESSFQTKTNFAFCSDLRLLLNFALLSIAHKKLVLRGVWATAKYKRLTCAHDRKQSFSRSYGSCVSAASVLFSTRNIYSFALIS